MQSLPKVQWYALSFLVFHTIVIAMVYAATRLPGQHLDLVMVYWFFDFPFLGIIERLTSEARDRLPDLYQYHDEIRFTIAAILGGLAYYTLGAAIGFVMTLVAPKTKEDLDSQDHFS